MQQRVGSAKQCAQEFLKTSFMTVPTCIMVHQDRFVVSSFEQSSTLKQRAQICMATSSKKEIWIETNERQNIKLET